MSPLTSAKTQHLFYAAALLITLTGFGLRLRHLGSDAFWIDELLTLWTAQSGTGAMLASPVHPPFLYLLTSFSLELFGESEFSTRLPALFAGTLAPPLLFAFGRRLNRPAVGLLAALLLVFSPAHLHHSQEARHYAWLMLFSLGSFLLLYNALRRPGWRRWLFYALLTVLNLYTHYAALVILATQTVIIIVWLLHGWLRGTGVQFLKMVRYPAGAAAVVLLCYLPWLPRVLDVLSSNTGEGVITSTGEVVPLSTWLNEIYTGFSLYPPYASLLTLLLVLAGVMVWGWQRQWGNFAFTLAALVLPLVVIYVGQPARGAYVRYVIYLLPFYLFFAALFLTTLLHHISRLGPTAPGAAIAICLLSIVTVGSAAVRQEYVAKHNDWHGILHHLQEEASDDDVLLLVSFNYTDGWNMIANTFTYYLHRQQTPYQVYDANAIDLEDAKALRESTANVWAIVDNWHGPERLLALPLDVDTFQNELYVVHDRNAQGTALQKTINLYERLAPLAGSPSPQCFLYQDLAYLRLASGDLSQAEQEHNRAVESCATLSIEQLERRQHQVELALLQHAVQAEKEQEARACPQRASV